MGIKVTYETTCDNCGKKVIRVIVLNNETARHSWGFDIWSPGWPEDWLQRVVEAREPWRPDPSRSHYFFCKDRCLYNWLLKHGQEIKHCICEEPEWDYETGLCKICGKPPLIWKA